MASYCRRTGTGSENNDGHTDQWLKIKSISVIEAIDT